MFSHKPIIQLLFFFIASVRALSLPRTSNQSQPIQWGPCGFNGTLPITCAVLDVPLDYTNESSDEVLHLSLIKVDAAIQPSKGSILFNFGGPGADGLHELAPLAALMQEYVEAFFPKAPFQVMDMRLTRTRITGGYNDMIAFDPR
jgi:hypothetical protein